MKGKVTVSGELCLRQCVSGNDNISTTNKHMNSNSVEENISELVTLSAGDEGLIQLREDIGNLHL